MYVLAITLNFIVIGTVLCTLCYCLFLFYKWFGATHLVLFANIPLPAQVNNLTCFIEWIDNFITLLNVNENIIKTLLKGFRWISDLFLKHFNVSTFNASVGILWFKVFITFTSFKLVIHYIIVATNIHTIFLCNNSEKKLILVCSF